MQVITVKYSATFGHGPVSGPVNGFLGALFIVLLARGWNKSAKAWNDAFPHLHHLGTFPWWAPSAIAAIGTAAALIVGYRHGTPGANIAYRVACWSVAGVWTTVTITFGWSMLGFILLCGGAVFAGVLSPVFAPAIAPEPAMTTEATPGESLEQEVLRLVMQMCGLKPHHRPTIKKVRDWERDAGSTFLITGVRGSTFSWRKLRDVVLDLAVALQLPDGCPVQAEAAGTHQAAALLHVSTRNYLGDSIDYPADYRPTSIMREDGAPREFSIGRYLDGTPTLIELYQAAGLIAGQRGGGKTVLLQNITATLVRSVDVVVWHIDLNGGGMSAAWTHLYATGELRYAPVDWVATSTSSALQMASAALRIAKARKARYQRKLIEDKTDVLRISPEIPMIFIIVDESAEVTGEAAEQEARKVSTALQAVQRIGRAMCVNVLFSTQRATGDYLPAALKKGSSVALCGRVKDTAELAHVFDWHKGLDTESLVHKGQFYIQRETGPVRMTKTYRILPPQIQDISRAAQPIRERTQVDALSRRAAGRYYAQRWEHPDTVAWLAELRGEGVTFDDDDVDFDFDDDGPDSDGSGSDGDLNDLESFNRTIRDLRAGRAKPATTQQQRPQAPTQPTRRQPPSGPMSDSDVDAFLAELERMATTPEPDLPTANPAGAAAVAEQNTRLARHNAILDYLRAHAGEDGVPTRAIVQFILASKLTDRDRTVNEDLGVLRADGKVTQEHAGRVVYGRWWPVDG